MGRSQEYSFVRVRPEFGVFCTDIGSTRVMIKGRDVYTTSDREVVKVLSAESELERYIEAEVVDETTGEGNALETGDQTPKTEE